MKLFESIGHMHLNGIEKTKELTEKKPVQTLLEEYCKNIYIPIVDAKALPISLKANVGDEVKVGTLIGTYMVFGNEMPVYSTVSGKIVGEEMLFHAGIGRPVKHFKIENDNKYECLKVCEPFTKDDSVETIIDNMQKLALVGLGGAGFPTFIKYKNVKDIDTLIINGVECEPFITTDYVAMMNESDLLVEGVELFLKASGAKKAYICFKNDRKDVKEKLDAILANHPNIEVKMVKNAYPMGWEKNLVKAITKRTYNKLPSEAHVIVNNVQTAIEFAKSSKTGFITYKKQITVSGEGIKKNGNVIIPIGTKVSSLVQAMGGYNVDEGVVLVGGPMCSKALMNDNVALLTSANALTVLKKVVRKAEPCLRCGACTEHCPSNVQPVEVKFCVETKNMERLALLNPNACVGCGLCSYICPSFIDVADFVKKGKLFLSIEEAKKKAQKGGK